MNVKIGTKVIKRKIATGRYRVVSDTTKEITHDPWYKDPTTLLAIGSFVVSVITLYLEAKSSD